MALASSPKVVLTREPIDNRAIASSLSALNVPVFEIPCVETQYLQAVELPQDVDAITFSSRRGVRGSLQFSLLERLLESSSQRKPVLAVVGAATGEELLAAGHRPDLIADPPEGRVLAGMLLEALAPKSRIALVRGNLRAGGMDEILARSGFILEPIVVYKNLEPKIPTVEPFPVAGVFVASPSAARRLLHHNAWMSSAPFFTIGATTADALAELGVSNVSRIGSDFEAWLEALVSAHRRAVEEM